MCMDEQQSGESLGCCFYTMEREPGPLDTFRRTVGLVERRPLCGLRPRPRITAPTPSSSTPLLSGMHRSIFGVFRSAICVGPLKMHCPYIRGPRQRIAETLHVLSVRTEVVVANVLSFST